MRKSVASDVQGMAVTEERAPARSYCAHSSQKASKLSSECVYIRGSESTHVRTWRMASDTV
jgi:hypothetical protein